MAPQTPKMEYSPHKRTRIASLYSSGVSAKAIATREGITPRAVYGISDRYRIQNSGRSQPRSGRPPILTERDKRAIMRQIKLNPFVANQELIRGAGLTCHIRTVTRWLQSEGIQQVTAPGRPK